MKNEKVQKTEKHRGRGKSPAGRIVDILIGGMIFIAIGVLLLLKNLGAIEPGLYKMLFSWQMLLVVLGVWSICRNKITFGVILAGIGAFFMIPRLAPVDSGWAATYWPFIFILLGVVILIHLFRPKRGFCNKPGCSETVREAKEGFVDVNNSFGAVRHIVLDPVFEGARIRTNMSGTILDLKHTSLFEGETYIDVDMTLSGLELHVPDSWVVETGLVSLTLAGVEDERYHTTPDNTRKLVIRGNMTLSGIEVKS